MRIVLSVALAAMLLTACKKKNEEAPPADPAAAPADPAAAPAPTPEPAPTNAPPSDAPAGADFIRVLAKHNPPKPDDPVKVELKQFTVKSANFNPADLTGATAEIEMTVAGLSSGIPKRDAHLQSPDYLDAAKFPAVTVKVSDVKKTEGQKHSAKAEVSAHGETQTWPIEFEVIQSTADSVQVKGNHAFKRSDFKLGKAEGDSTADELSIEYQLTIKKTAP
jgi:polyisoprenoid-binding protein YceI